MDTCAATQDESDVEASNETSTDSCPRISNVSLSCRPFKSYAEYIASNAAFNLIIMFMLLFYLQYDFRLQIRISFISTLRIILFIFHDYSVSSPHFLLGTQVDSELFYMCDQCYPILLSQSYSLLYSIFYVFYGYIIIRCTCIYPRTQTIIVHFSFLLLRILLHFLIN